MKNYVRPSVVNFGEAVDLIQGCGGWGTEGITFNSASYNHVFLWNGSSWYCACTNISGQTC